MPGICGLSPVGIDKKGVELRSRLAGAPVFPCAADDEVPGVETIVDTRQDAGTFAIDLRQQDGHFDDK